MRKADVALWLEECETLLSSPDLEPGSDDMYDTFARICRSDHEQGISCSSRRDRKRCPEPHFQQTLPVTSILQQGISGKDRAVDCDDCGCEIRPRSLRHRAMVPEPV